jgi:hypothetical protein
MSESSTLTRRTLLAILAVMVAVAGAIWVRWTSPKLYKTAVSPDSTWSDRVLRQRNWFYPAIDGVLVTVEARDSKSRVLSHLIIDNRDRWEEVEERYPEVICRNDVILVGPRWFDGDSARYFRINKRDLSHSVLPDWWNRSR